MYNLKKIRKKLLTSVLGTTLLTGGLVGIQSVSAMNNRKCELPKFYMLTVAQKIRDKETLFKYAQINKKCSNTLEMTHFNPVPVTTENAKKLFPRLQTLCLYGSETNVDEIKDKKIIFDYSFGIGEFIHYVSFFNGYDKEYSDELISKVKDVQEIFELELKLEKLNKHSSNSSSDQEKIQKIAERIQRIKEKYQNYQELEKNLSIELNNLLSNLPIIYKCEYEYLKNFINCMASEFDDVELSEKCEGIKYTIDTIESKGENSKKALVYIVVKGGNKLERRHLEHIIGELKKKGVEIPAIRSAIIRSDQLDFRNVIFTIRPEKEQKFKISDDSFYKFCNLTVNIVRAKAGHRSFCYCSDSVINIYDSYFVNDKKGFFVDRFIFAIISH